MWIKNQILETGREGSCVSSIYQQGNYTWQLVLCEMMSYLGRNAKTSPPSRVVFPAMLFVCLLFKNHTCITLTYSWLCDGIVRLLDTQIMQITKWRGGKKQRSVQQMCIFQKSLCSESACPGSGHQPHNPSQICGGHWVYAKLQCNNTGTSGPSGWWHVLLCM